jgi:hypothetical protein
VRYSARPSTTHNGIPSASPPFGDSRRAVVDEAGHDECLIEIGLRAVEHDRLSPVQLFAEQNREPPEPPLRQTTDDVNRLAPILMKVDIEVLGVENLELVLPVLHLVLAEVLSRGVSSKYV